MYIFGRDHGLRPNVFIHANKLKKSGQQFVREHGSTDMFEEEGEKNYNVLYKKLVKNCMARIYSYCTQRLFIKGKVETFNICIDLN